jgi:signal transduction histidine kinase
MRAVKNDSSTRVKLYLAVFWLLLASSLICWWLYFALGLLARLAPQDEPHRHMLMLEGVTLLLLLVAGGTTLIYFVFQEQKQKLILAKFFSAFSHDIKTSLASLRLQAESLKEDVKAPEAQPIIGRLLSDASRLQVQVENSLFLGQSSAPKLFIEDLQSADLLVPLQESWPQMQFIAREPFVLSADRRALETVLNNLVHNAAAHGRATVVEFRARESVSGSGRIELFVRDNGSGFAGDRSQLARMHSRHNPSSGSGLGLFIARELVKMMNGELEFSPATVGFEVRVTLPGRTI